MKLSTEHYHATFSAIADHIRLTKYPLVRDLIAEFAGMTVLVAFATGVAAQAHLTEGAFGHILDISTGYAAGWALGLFIAGSRTPGMCNPCIAFANALVGRLNPLTMLLFWLVELLGAIIGTLLVLAIYWEKLRVYTLENDNGILNMGTTGQIFASSANASISSLCVQEVITGIFTMMGVMAILDKNNWNLPRFYVVVYAAVVNFLLVNDFTVLSTSTLNPAYDLGGRIALAMTGWGASPFTFHYNCFWVFLIMPFCGTILGILLYELGIGIHLPGAEEDEGSEKSEAHEESSA